MPVTFTGAVASSRLDDDLDRGVPVVHRPLDDGGPWFVGGRSLRRLLDDAQRLDRGSVRGAQAAQILLDVTHDEDLLVGALEEALDHRPPEGTYLSALLVKLANRNPARIAKLFPRAAGPEVLACCRRGVGLDVAVQMLSSSQAADRGHAVTALRYLIEDEGAADVPMRALAAAVAIEDDEIVHAGLETLIAACEVRAKRPLHDRVLAAFRRQDTGPEADSVAPDVEVPVHSQRGQRRTARGRR